MALTKRYVTQDGAGDNSGSSEANAMTWEQMIADINTPRAGYKYLVKSGTYANATTSTVLTGDGSTTSPNVIEGYATTEGDLYLGRSSGGALNTTGFPAISYTGTTARFNATGAQYLVVACLSITSAASAATVDIATNSTVNNCSVTNTSAVSANGSAIEAVQASASNINIINCDTLTTASGGTRAIRSTSTNTQIVGCRIKCPNGSGILIRDTFRVIGCTIYECGANGIATDATSAQGVIINNTIVNCTSGDGVYFITSSSGAQLVIGNHITGCVYGIQFNTSTCVKQLAYNRFRDNTSGNINGGGDWEEGTSVANVTSDDTDSLDFTDQSTDDYSLKAGAAATSKGIGYLIDIGANGTPVVSGGGSPLRFIIRGS